MNTDRVTYQELAANYGEKMANALLAVVEKNAGITHEVRLQRALEALNKTDPHFVCVSLT